MVCEDEGAITLSPSNFIDMKMNFLKCSYISWAKYYESPEIMIENTDILFVKTGSSFGKSCYVENLPKEATINPQLVVFKNIKIDKKFFFYTITSNEIEHQTKLAVVGGTIPTMSQEKIGNFSFALPSLDEQKEIAEFLDKKCEKIDKINENYTKQTASLKEYKKSLIYECVTGKKEI